LAVVASRFATLNVRNIFNHTFQIDTLYRAKARGLVKSVFSNHAHVRHFIETQKNTFWISGSKMAIFRGKIGEEWCDIDPNELVLTFGGLNLYVKFGENRQRNATVRVTTHGQTRTHTHRHPHRRTDANIFYYLSHAICYSYGADKNAICNKHKVNPRMHINATRAF